jgi:hypothetical protein
MCQPWNNEGREVEEEGGLFIRETNCYNILAKVEQLKYEYACL